MSYSSHNGKDKWVTEYQNFYVNQTLVYELRNSSPFLSSPSHQVLPLLSFILIAATIIPLCPSSPHPPTLPLAHPLVKLALIPLIHHDTIDPPHGRWGVVGVTREMWRGVAGEMEAREVEGREQMTGKVERCVVAGMTIEWRTRDHIITDIMNTVRHRQLVGRMFLVWIKPNLLYSET